jgi:hypothetical protein
MKPRVMLACLACLACVVVLASQAGADSKEEKEPKPAGRPKQFTQGKGTMYAVWYEDGIWKLRTTAPEGKGKKAFTGTITVEGDRLIGDFSALEKAKNAGKADWALIGNGGRSLSFQFATFGATDGIDFKVGPKAKSITFHLKCGGDDDPKIIFIGAKGQHPAKALFTLPATPDK